MILVMGNWCSLGHYVSPPLTWGRHIVFGCVVVVCVIPCELYNFGGVLNFIFKLEPYIDHIKVLDELKNW